MKRILPIVVVLCLSPLSRVRAEPLRDSTRVVATTRSTVYLDAGRDQGLSEGQRWIAPIAGTPVTITVLAASGTTAVVSMEGAMGSIAVGGDVPLPPGRAAPPPGPGPRPPPSPSPPWIPALAADALPRLGAPPADVVTSASRRRTELLVHGEVAARASVGADLGGQSRSSEDVGLSSDLSAELGPWAWDHIFDLHYSARPETLAAPLQHGVLRFDAYLARLGWTSSSGTVSAAVGRMSAAVCASWPPRTWRSARGPAPVRTWSTCRPSCGLPPRV